MARQIKAKTLITKQLSPAPLTSTGKRRISCSRCKKGTGANRRAQDIKEIRLKMQQQNYILESNENTGVVLDSISVLAALGIGVVTEIPTQPSPRSEDNTAVNAKADFSLLKIETDETQIPNAKIIDRKSKILKRGINRYVTADQIAPFDENGSFFKPDEFATRNQAKNAEILSDTLQKRNMSGLVRQLVKQQSRISNRLMEPHFKKAMGKGQ